MKTDYESHSNLPELLARAGELSVRTIILDVEPLVADWRSGQSSLDHGVAFVVEQASALPTVRAVVFATNSDRRPSALPARPGIRVGYLASARKPLRIEPYRGLPRPGAVIGDQVATDGLLARRLGYTFLQYRLGLADVPLGPRLLQQAGRVIAPLIFTRPAAPPR